MALFAGDGKGGAPDPVRRTFDAEHRPRVVTFFRDLYVDSGHQLSGLRAAEHTAQVRAEDREEREKAFRTASCRCCSARRPWSSASTSRRSTPSPCATSRRRRPTTPSAAGEPAAPASRPLSSPTAPRATATTATTSSARTRWSPARSRRPGSTWPTRTSSAPTSTPLARRGTHPRPTAGLQSSMSSVLDLGHKDFPVRARAGGRSSAIPSATSARTHGRPDLLGPLEAELQAGTWWAPDWSDRVIDRARDEFDDRLQPLARALPVRRDASATSPRSSPPTTPRARTSGATPTVAGWRHASGSSCCSTSPTPAASRTSTPTATSPPRGSCPATPSRGCPLRHTSPGSRAGSGGLLAPAPPLPGHQRVRPDALIYHEGARYQVTRIALPRGHSGDGAADVVRSRLKVCQACGYHHEADPGPDVCEECGERLGQTWIELLQLQTVITRRRERISADEEERNRVGYELHTTYRYMPRGTHPGFSRATSRIATTRRSSRTSPTATAPSCASPTSAAGTARTRTSMASSSTWSRAAGCRRSRASSRAPTPTTRAWRPPSRTSRPRPGSSPT